ncbi:MAG: isoprenylcysteine carboxylmethyltransferase family protein [Alphaproteobacteria bacterium]
MPIGTTRRACAAGCSVEDERRPGPAWSLVPKADRETGIVTTGPYRQVRHPIYLGLTMLAAGQAVAFSSWPALLIVLTGLAPNFAWRACAEETLLSRTFGERYAACRRRTRMIIPNLVRGTAGPSRFEYRSPSADLDIRSRDGRGT